MSRCILCKSKLNSHPEIKAIHYDPDNYYQAIKELSNSMKQFLITNGEYRQIVNNIVRDENWIIDEICFDNELEDDDAEELQEYIHNFNRRTNNSKKKLMRVVDWLERENNFIYKLKITEKQEWEEFTIWRNGIVISTESCQRVEEIANVLVR